MTEASYNKFTDRRNAEQRVGELATQILLWYDEEGRGKSWSTLEMGKPFRRNAMKRRRTNGLAITTSGELLVSRATCSRQDQFSKAQGRLVVEKRICYRAKSHLWVLRLDEGDFPEAAAAAYAEVFPEDEIGVKRAYNAGKVFTSYKADIERRANELDGFDE